MDAEQKLAVIDRLMNEPFLPASPLLAAMVRRVIVSGFNPYEEERSA